MRTAIRAGISIVLLFFCVALCAEPKTLTGKVTCSMCRGKHEMGVADDAECVRKCVKNGARYVLTSGGDTYLLEGNPRQFDYYAEKSVTIRGEVEAGRIVKIESISVVK